MSNRFYVLAAALTGCAVAASAVILRQRSRRDAMLQHKEDIQTWEGEGGKVAPSALRPVPAP